MSYDWETYHARERLSDYNTRKFKYLEVRPINTTINFPSSIITLDTSTVSYESFMFLKQSYVDVEVEILNGANKYNHEDNIALNNGCSLFNRVDLSINGTAVNNTPNKEPALNQLLLMLLKGYSEAEQSAQYSFYDNVSISEYSGIIKQTVGDNGGSADTQDVNDALEYLNEVLVSMVYPKRISDSNFGQVKRLARVPYDLNNGDKATFHVRIPLSVLHPFCNQNKPIRGARFRLDLHPEPNLAKVLFGDAGVDAFNANTKIDVKNVVMQLAILQPSLQVWGTLNKSIAGESGNKGQPIPLAYNNIQCLTYEINNNNIKMDLFSHSPKVSHVFIGFRAGGRYTGDVLDVVKNNKLMFDRFESLRGHIRLGENIFPSEGYYDTGRASGWSELYENFLSATYASGLAYDYPQGSTNITFNQWQNVYPLIYFDCTKADETFANMSPDQKLSVDLEVGRTGTELAGGNYQMVVYIISDEYLLLQEENGALSITSYTPSDLQN